MDSLHFPCVPTWVPVSFTTYNLICFPTGYRWVSSYVPRVLNMSYPTHLLVCYTAQSQCFPSRIPMSVALVLSMHWVCVTLCSRTFPHAFRYEQSSTFSDGFLLGSFFRSPSVTSDFPTHVFSCVFHLFSEISLVLRHEFAVCSAVRSAKCSLWGPS